MWNLFRSVEPGADKIEKVGKSGSGPIGSGTVVSRDSLTLEPREYL